MAYREQRIAGSKPGSAIYSQFPSAEAPARFGFPGAGFLWISPRSGACNHRNSRRRFIVDRASTSVFHWRDCCLIVCFARRFVQTEELRRNIRGGAFCGDRDIGDHRGKTRSKLRLFGSALDGAWSDSILRLCVLFELEDDSAEMVGSECGKLVCTRVVGDRAGTLGGFSAMSRIVSLRA